MTVYNLDNTIVCCCCFLNFRWLLSSQEPQQNFHPEMFLVLDGTCNWNIAYIKCVIDTFIFVGTIIFTAKHALICLIPWDIVHIWSALYNCTFSFNITLVTYLDVYWFALTPYAYDSNIHPTYINRTYLKWIHHTESGVHVRQNNSRQAYNTGKHRTGIFISAELDRHIREENTGETYSLTQCSAGKETTGQAYSRKQLSTGIYNRKTQETGIFTNKTFCRHIGMENREYALLAHDWHTL